MRDNGRRGRTGQAARAVLRRLRGPRRRPVAAAERPAALPACPGEPGPAGQPGPRLRGALRGSGPARGRPFGLQGAVDGPGRAGPARRAGHRPARGRPDPHLGEPGRRGRRGTTRAGAPRRAVHQPRATSATACSRPPWPTTASCSPTSRTPTGRCARGSGWRRCARRRGWPWPGTGPGGQATQGPKPSSPPGRPAPSTIPPPRRRPRPWSAATSPRDTGSSRYAPTSAAGPPSAISGSACPRGWRRCTPRPPSRPGRPGRKPRRGRSSGPSACWPPRWPRRASPTRRSCAT